MRAASCPAALAASPSSAFVREFKSLTTAAAFRSWLDPILPARSRSAAMLRTPCGEVKHGQPALIPALNHDVATRHRNQSTIMRDTILLLCLSCRQLVITSEPQLLVNDVENGVRPPGRRVGGAASRARASTPLVGEDHLRTIIIKRRRVPVGEVLIDDLIEPNRMHGIGDVEQDSVARACSGSKGEFRKNRDVMALIRNRRSLSSRSVITATPKTGNIPGGGIGKDARPVHDLCALRRGKRYLNDIDTEKSRLKILVRSLARAACELLRGADLAGPLSVDVNVGFVFRIDDERMGVRSTAGLNGRHLPGISQVADVED